MNERNLIKYEGINIPSKVTLIRVNFFQLVDTVYIMCIKYLLVYFYAYYCTKRETIII